jgi:hypothetical protein
VPVSTVLVASGTILPAAGSTVNGSSPARRLRQYREALSVYLDTTPWDVLFVENSSPSLAYGLQDSLTNPRLTVLNTTSSPGALARGKGACEGEMLVSAYEALQSGVTDVVKVTGRLGVINILQVLSRDAQPAAISVEYDARLRFCDVRLFRMPIDQFGRSAARLAAEVDDPAGLYAEHVLMRCVAGELSAGARLEPFGELPKFSGESATSGQRYDGMLASSKRRLHSAARWAYLRSGMTL